MGRKQKIMEALLGESNIAELSSEDISWANSYLPNHSDERNQQVTGILLDCMKYNHEAERIDEAVPTENGAEKLRELFKSLPQEPKLSVFIEKSVKKLDEEMILFMFTKFATELLEGYQEAQLKAALGPFYELFKQMKKKGD